MGGLARLIAAYDDPDAIVDEAIAAGRRPIRTVGWDAPHDYLTAAGFQPIRLSAPVSLVTTRADAIVGRHGLGPRGRRLVERLLTADEKVPVLITSADIGQTQVFAILRELARLGEAAPAPLFLLDRRHQPRASTEAYNRARMEELSRWLEARGGRAPTADAIERSQAAGRRHADRLDALRRDGRITGALALRIVGSGAILDGAGYDAALGDALDEIESAPPRAGATLFLAGTAHDDATLYEAIEACGLTIVGERFTRAGTIPGETADATVDAARAAGATHLIHLSIDGDEAAPWDIAALRARCGDALAMAALPASSDQPARIAGKVEAFVAGASSAAPPAPTGGTRPDAVAKPPVRSRKSLASIADFSTYQREWFADVRRRAAGGSPFAVVNANAPQEILRALDIPFVVNQWWASIVAAKQQSRRYLGLLAAHDYPTRAEPYSAQGIAAAFDDDADAAPWGGLPHPDFLHAIQSSDATAKIFGAWAHETGARPYLYERTVDPRWDISTNWWEALPDRWDEALEPARLDLLVAEMRAVIATLEAATGRRFDQDRFVAVLDLVNEQEEYYRRTRDLIARTVPAPIGIVDSMPATMVPQWHRGTIWGRDAAKAFHDEVAARVRDGLAAVPNQRVRLMFVGRGLWSDMAFYQKWEESHGAIFVWSMYLALAADGYIRRHDRGRDPLRALAARFLTMGDELRMPSWAAPWHVHEARTNQVDGAVALADADPFVLRALEQAGVPVLALDVDNFNREGEDAAAIDARVAAFIEGPAGTKASARRGA